jgi:hypothetical protein
MSGWSALSMIRAARSRPRTRREDIETVEYLLDRYQQAVMALAAVPRVRTNNPVERALDKERQTMVDGTLRWIAWARDELRSREP